MFIDAAFTTIMMVVPVIIFAVLIMHLPFLSINSHCDKGTDKDRRHDERLIQKAHRVAKSAKNPEQIECSTQYLKLINDELKTSYGKWLLKILLDELVPDVMDVECCDRCCRVYEVSLPTCPYCEDNQ